MFHSINEDGKSVVIKHGFLERQEVGETSTGAVRDLLKWVTTVTGIETNEGASNENSEDALWRRTRLVSRSAEEEARIVRRMNEGEEMYRTGKS